MSPGSRAPNNTGVNNTAGVSAFKWATTNPGAARLPANPRPATATLTGPQPAVTDPFAPYGGLT